MYNSKTCTLIKSMPQNQHGISPIIKRKKTGNNQKEYTTLKNQDTKRVYILRTFKNLDTTEGVQAHLSSHKDDREYLQD